MKRVIGMRNNKERRRIKRDVQESGKRKINRRRRRRRGGIEMPGDSAGGPFAVPRRYVILRDRMVSSLCEIFSLFLCFVSEYFFSSSFALLLILL